MLKWLMEREGVVPPDSERDSYAALEASRHFVDTSK